MEIRKAQRRRSKLRLGLTASSGAGKTYSALLIAYGIANGGKIGVIDTEAGSAELYDDIIPGGYDVIPLSAPYTPARYVEAIHTFEKAGYAVIITDSLTHAWAGEGGSLDKQGKLADKGTNSFTAWRSVTPDHNKLVEAILQSSCHMICTLRAKTEYVLEENGKGKQVPKKVGMAPIMRDGFEYEMTVCFELDQNHVASSTKDRTQLFDGLYFTPTIATGAKLLAWLDGGAEPDPVPEPEPCLTKANVDAICAVADATVIGRINTAYDTRVLADIPARFFPAISKRLGLPALNGHDDGGMGEKA